MNTARATEIGTPRKVLAFHLGGEEYGIDLLQVQEVMGTLPITRVPGAPEHVLGVVNLRGRIVPVIDPSRRVHPAAAETEKRCTVFVRSGASVAGLLVDGVDDILTLSSEELADVPDLGPAVDATLLLGLARQGERLTVLLDVDRLIADPTR